MTTRTIRRLATITATTLLLALTIHNASARSLSTSEQSFRVSWASMEWTSSLATIRCRTTLEGSFHTRTIAKVERSLVGAVTRVLVAHPCTNGEAWIDNGTEAEPLGTAPNKLPFHMTYENFTGTLPNITAVGGLASRISFVIQATSLGISARCRYGRLEDNISSTATREAGGGITSMRHVTGRNTISLVDGLLNGSFCPSTAQLTGTSGAVTGLNNTNTISVTLI